MRLHAPADHGANSPADTPADARAIDARADVRAECIGDACANARANARADARTNAIHPTIQLEQLMDVGVQRQHQIWLRRAQGGEWHRAGVRERLRGRGCVQGL